ncbi:hypothetical protein B484DRAFT_10473 [Ochromonadaceae sp. CCMP2298]|nr:hypothetical protein B484DRAFT_10473 [Ochromonadaceae sp. CCMP2298]|mmetsp:Transcript_22580/g.50203  ORF Transcript_22580/g.50203 Transcript_22580/m.50203 type:complete len:456 (+) Transcript_22580:114-1481(+)
MADKLKQVISEIESGARLTKVDLSNAGLKEFPRELFAVKDTLESLNMGGNELSELPQDITEFTKLRVMFFAGNRFEHIPVQLGRMPALWMLSFKSCQLKEVHASSLSPSICWLILTDNLIPALPSTIGALKGLRKLMLAGNKLQVLPQELSACTDLELLRISANELQALPDWLLQMPNLSWLAFAGNPLSLCDDEANAPLVPWTELTMGEQIGEGASGFVHRAVWKRAETVFSGSTIEVAVKLFKGETTSDGLPANEMECLEALGTHPNLVPLLGRLSGAPLGQQGLVFPLLDLTEYSVLGAPPSLQTITRDTFPTDTQFSEPFAARALGGVASACAHLHAAGLLHGDLYAHNTMVLADGSPLLTDFGAASLLRHLTPQQRRSLQLLEVRAFGCLVDDLLQYTQYTEGDALQYTCKKDALLALRDQCLAHTPSRPLFVDILAQLDEISSIKPCIP